MNLRTKFGGRTNSVLILMTLVTSAVSVHSNLAVRASEPTQAPPSGEQAEIQPQFGDWGDPFVEPQHPGRDHFGGWHLGVFGHYTTTGHLLTQVFPNTPAARAGLEPGDRIITVNGYQVGDVLNRQYPIDVLIQRHASPTGFVRLLVQNRRTLRLHNLDVRLARGRIHF
ncbi:PDZ domain-containing protein [Novipirellula caenicola]|uniref:PDZ domain-containing protein n=1 Tax=Novipirellula caenicola TaxID=1536901 RepID=A0ABP9VTY4_9BACT